MLNKKSIISLLLMGSIATSTVQAGFWTKEEPTATESFVNTINFILKKGKKVAKTLYKYKEMLAATGIIGTIIINRIMNGSKNALDDFIDGGVDTAAAVASYTPLIGEFLEKNMKKYFKANRAEKNLAKQKIETKKINTSLENAYPKDENGNRTADKAVSEILKTIEDKTKETAKRNKIQERINGLEIVGLNNGNQVEYNNLKSSLEKLNKDIEGNLTPRFIMLFGVPQTGKSFDAMAIAKAFGAKECIHCTGGKIRNCFEGKSVEIVNDLFDRAEQLATKDVPGVIIIDEFDGATAGHNNDKSNGLSREIAEQLQDRLDPRNFKKGSFKNIVVIATTNYIDDKSIPEAIKARVHRLIKKDLPSPEIRKIRLQHFLAAQSLKFTDNDLNRLVNLTDGWNLANLERLSQHLALKDQEKRSNEFKQQYQNQNINHDIEGNINFGNKAQWLCKKWLYEKPAGFCKKAVGVIKFWEKKQEEVLDIKPGNVSDIADFIHDEQGQNTKEDEIKGLKTAFDTEDKKQQEQENNLGFAANNIPTNTKVNIKPQDLQNNTELPKLIADALQQQAHLQNPIVQNIQEQVDLEAEKQKDEWYKYNFLQN